MSLLLHLHVLQPVIYNLNCDDFHKQLPYFFFSFKILDVYTAVPLATLHITFEQMLAQTQNSVSGHGFQISSVKVLE